MAGLTIPSKGLDIEYSCKDGRIISFEYENEVLYDESKNIEVDGWEEKLILAVNENELNVYDGKGFHAFIYPLYEDGKVELVKPA